MSEKQTENPARRALPALSVWTAAVVVLVWVYAGVWGAERFAVTGLAFPGAATSVAEFLGSVLGGLSASWP